MTISNKQTLYFGYGSNLWLHQMSTRCPESTYLGIARLNGYKWLINDRGYANVVEVSSSPSSSSTTTTTTNNASTSDPATPHVYGLVYSLSPTDEARLDKNEGVPVAYTKEHLPCDFWSVDSTSTSSSSSYPRKIDTTRPPNETDKPLLVYIDRKRTAPSVPRQEYVYRMNRGIEDALKCGVPEEYVRDVMRVYIPSDDDEGKGEGGAREKMAEYAKKQAAAFRDESGVIE